MGPRQVQDGPTLGQHGPRWGQDRSNMGQDEAQGVPLRCRKGHIVKNSKNPGVSGVLGGAGRPSFSFAEAENHFVAGTARRGSTPLAGYTIGPFLPVEFACATGQPGPCVRALCELLAPLSKNMACMRPRCSATPSEHFVPRHMHLALHTLHFISSHLISSEVFSPYLISFGLISSHSVSSCMSSKKVLFICSD